MNSLTASRSLGRPSIKDLILGEERMGRLVGETGAFADVGLEWEFSRNLARLAFASTCFSNLESESREGLLDISDPESLPGYTKRGEMSCSIFVAGETILFGSVFVETSCFMSVFGFASRDEVPVLPTLDNEELNEEM